MKRLLIAALMLVALPLAAQTSVGTYRGDTTPLVWKDGTGGHAPISVGRHDQTAATTATWTSATPLDTRLTFATANYSTIALSITTTSTITAGGVVFELSDDNGATWTGPVGLSRADSFLTDTSYTLIANTKQAWQRNTGAFTTISVRLNPAITGTGSATLRIQASATDTTRLITAAPLQRFTYTAATAARLATTAGTAPFFSICGSATRSLRVQDIVVSGTVATAAIYGDVQLRKTSTSTSAGTATALVKVPRDSNDPASTSALVNFYTVLATAGTLVGNIGSQGAVFPITGTVAASEARVEWNWFARSESEAPVLRGTAQCIEGGFGTTPTNAPTLQVEVTYTEE